MFNDKNFLFPTPQTSPFTEQNILEEAVLTQAIV